MTTNTTASDNSDATEKYSATQEDILGAVQLDVEPHEVSLRAERYGDDDLMKVILTSRQVSAGAYLTEAEARELGEDLLKLANGSDE